MPRPVIAVGVALLVGCSMPDGRSLKAREIAEARAVFEENLDAIRRRDVEAYLAGYLPTADLVYLGPEGLSRGFEPFAAARRMEPAFPDSLEAGTPELTWIAPGVVHVAYPFAARQGAVAGAGWSERLLVRTQAGWRIAVTTVIPVVGDQAQ